MSLVSTLGTMAIGMVAMKAVSGGGIGKLLGGAGGAAGGLGGLLGGGGQQGGAAGGIGGLLGGAQGGQQQGQAGGAGGLLGGLAGGAGAGGLGGLLGGAAGGAGGAGGLGGLLDGLGGGAGAAGAGAAAGGVGGFLNNALSGEQPTEAPTQQQEETAKILIQAMVNAAKADGQIDESEQQKIVSNLGEEVSEEERNFVLSEMQSPLDFDGFVASVPAEAQKQVYLMSIMAIDLDTQEEAQYLDKLRESFGMSKEETDAIHNQLGVPALYS